MATFNIEVKIPDTLADNFDDLHKFQKHIMYQVTHYNEYAKIAEVFDEEIWVNKFEEVQGED